MDSTAMGAYGYLITQLNRFNIAYLHCAEGATAGSRDLQEGIGLDALRDVFDGAYPGNNGYWRDLAVARRAKGKVGGGRILPSVHR